jgi:hypothetical protein
MTQTPLPFSTNFGRGGFDDMALKTIGTISALFGLSHHVIDQSQYSVLVAGVIGSALRAGASKR